MHVASISGGDLAKVFEMKTMGLSKDSEARSLLQRIADQVQPVMRKRKWRVLLLSEFYPRDSALLGLNIGAGQEIRIRLRKPGREGEFLPYESLVGTMLHELVHNVHGPHNADFYKLLDEITEECEDFMAKGISGTGQGFDARGTRLGGLTHNPTTSNMRNVILSAAEKRARIGSLMPTGPRRLGGDSVILKTLSPAQAASMAAERRLRDDVWCGAPNTVGENESELITGRETTDSPSSLDTTRILVSTSSPENSESSWQCKACTLLNPPLAVLCAACSEVRSKAGGEIWICQSCTLENSKTWNKCAACNQPNSEEIADGWSCKFCTLRNNISSDKCAACGEWRYSYGPPVATLTPYRGT